MAKADEITVDVKIVNHWLDEKKADLQTNLIRLGEIVWTMLHPRRALDRYYSLIDIYVRQVIREEREK